MKGSGKVLLLLVAMLVLGQLKGIGDFITPLIDRVFQLTGWIIPLAVVAIYIETGIKGARETHSVPESAPEAGRTTHSRLMTVTRSESDQPISTPVLD